MPPSGTLAVIHSHEGLGIKSLSHIYKECHAVSHATSRLKADTAVNTALDSRVAREQKWTRKGSITTYCEEHFQAIPLDIDQTPPKQIDIVKDKIKRNISEEVKYAWQNHVKDLVVQGKFLELLALEQTHLTWRSLIYNLPRGLLQFAINASIDTLATNANLKRWGKRSNAKCSICSKRETLHHTLNHCDQMLDRYLWRHNSLLSYIRGIVSDGISDDISIYIDLPFEHEGASTVPIDVVITKLKQKPDLVLVDRINKKVTLFELSVPFETNMYIDNK